MFWSAFVHVRAVSCSSGGRGDCKEGDFDSRAVEGLLFLRDGGVVPGSLFACARRAYGVRWVLGTHLHGKAGKSQSRSQSRSLGVGGFGTYAMSL
jgi:hypothetical protein